MVLIGDEYEESRNNIGIVKGRKKEEHGEERNVDSRVIRVERQRLLKGPPVSFGMSRLNQASTPSGNQGRQQGY
jgi:hypothetical protein